MSRGKKIYFGLLILSVFLVSTFYFSYAFFANKIEGHGKLNLVAGTLDYKIESSSLKNNEIEVVAGSNIEFTLTITSLNTISSKYELYYKLEPNIEEIEVGYCSNTKDKPKNLIDANEKKEIKVKIRNNTDKKVTVTFGVHGGLSNLAYDDISKIGKSLKELKDEDIMLAYNYEGTKTKPSNFPNKGEGYIVESLNCTGADGEWDAIKWGPIFTNITAPQISCIAELRDEIPENYGTSIQTSYPSIYTNNSPTTPITKTSDYDNHYNGNYAYPHSLYSNIIPDSTAINNLPYTSMAMYSLIVNGTNNHNLWRETKERWVSFYFHAGYSTPNETLSDFKLGFKDGSKLTVQQAITNGYIEPLVILSSFYYSTSFSNFYNSMLMGESTSGNYSMGLVFIKVKSKSPLISYSFTSDVNWNTYHDGIEVREYPEGTKISTQPLK